MAGMSRKRLGRVTTALATVVLLSACGVSGDPLSGGSDETAQPAETVTIGWVQQEQELIAQAYATALEADEVTVEVKQYPNRRDAIVSLQAGELDVLPEYSGELVLFFAQGNPAAGDVDEATKFLTETLAPDVRVLEPATAGSQFVFAVPPAVTEQFDLISLADAAPYLKGRTLAGPEDLETAPYGAAGFEGLYGIQVDFTAVADPDELVAGLNSGDIAVAAFRSTDPRIDAVVTLDDPQQMVPSNAIVALASKDVVDSSVIDTVNEVQAALDEEGLLALTGDVERPAAEVAHEWAAERDLAD